MRLHRRREEAALPQLRQLLVAVPPSVEAAGTEKEVAAHDHGARLPPLLRLPGALTRLHCCSMRLPEKEGEAPAPPHTRAVPLVLLGAASASTAQPRLSAEQTSA